MRQFHYVNIIHFSFFKKKNKNATMLWKQGWKFMTNLDTILKRISKLKNFPHEDFLEAVLGPIHVMFSIVPGGPK